MPQSYVEPVGNSGIPDYKNNPNYNPNHPSWYPGEVSNAYREGWERIFGKKDKDNEE